MGTNASSLTSYLSVSALLARADLRTVCQLVSDASPPAPVAAASLPTDPNLAAALLDASGYLESRMLMGERYTSEDLANLTGCAQGYFFRLLANLTVCFLYDRRVNPESGEPPFYKRTLEEMDALASGKAIFGTLEVAAAGLQSHVVDNREIVDNERHTVSAAAHRLFGVRRVRESPCGPPYP